MSVATHSLKERHSHKPNLRQHPLATLFPNGTVSERSNGRLRIEGDEQHMEQLISEVNAAYYDGVFDIGRVDVVVSQSEMKSRKPSVRVLHPIA